MQRFCARARAPAAGWGTARGLRRFYGGFVIGCGLALHKADGAGGARGQAIAQAVAIVVAQQFCLAAHHANGALVAGRRAGAAAVAFFFVYVNDFA